MTADSKAIASWEVLDSTYNYRDRWLALRSDTVRLPNGRVLTPFHVIEQPDWVTAIALTHDGSIVLAEEYRHGARQTVIELPCGVHDKPGEPLAAVQRELREETGFASDDRHPLGSFFANAPRMNNRVHCFLALDAAKVAEPALDDGEVIVPHEVPFADFQADLQARRRVLHGFQSGAMWLLLLYAKSSGDKRLAAFTA